MTGRPRSRSTCASSAAATSISSSRRHGIPSPARPCSGPPTTSIPAARGSTRRWRRHVPGQPRRSSRRSATTRPATDWPWSSPRKGSIHRRATMHLDGHGRALITVDARRRELDRRRRRGQRRAAPRPLPDARVVLGQLEIPIDVVADAFAQARAVGAVTILNPAPAAAFLTSCSPVHDRDPQRARDGARSAARPAASTSVSRRWSRRSVARASRSTHRHGRRRIPPFAVTPIDTTGAGDAFCGAFAVAIAEGADPLTPHVSPPPPGRSPRPGRGPCRRLPRRVARSRPCLRELSAGLSRCVGAGRGSGRPDRHSSGRRGRCRSAAPCPA